MICENVTYSHINAVVVFAVKNGMVTVKVGFLRSWPTEAH